MVKKDLGVLKEELNKKYDTDILGIEDNSDGSVSFLVDSGSLSPEFLEDNDLNDEKVVGSVVNRSRLSRSYLDLQDKKDILKKTPHDLYTQSNREYYVAKLQCQVSDFEMD